MDITFLVGNGFDIAQNLKTSYKDFCKWYCEQASSNPNIIKLKKDINSDYKYWSDFEKAIGEYSNQFTPATVEDYIECVDDARENLNYYLNQIIKDFAFPSFSADTKNEIRRRLAEFYEELNNPRNESTLTSMIKRESVNIRFVSFNYTNILDLYVSSFLDGPIKIWEFSGHSQSMRVIQNVLHVHGKNGLFPVIGVDNESQIMNQSLFKVDSYISEAIIKARSINATGYDWDEQLLKYIDNSSIVCIFGMSLGQTDQRWWVKLLDWLSSAPDRRLIIYNYCDNPPDSISIDKRLGRIKEVKKKLANYDEKNIWDTIEERIYVIFNSHIFDFSKLK